MNNEGPPGQRLKIETDSEGTPWGGPPTQEMYDESYDIFDPVGPEEGGEGPRQAPWNLPFSTGVHRNIYRKRGRRDPDWVYTKYMINGHFDWENYIHDHVDGTDFIVNEAVINAVVHYLKRGQIWPWDAINVCLSFAIVHVKPGSPRFTNYLKRSKFDWRDCFKPLYATTLPQELLTQLYASFQTPDNPDYKIWESWHGKYSRSKLPDAEFRQHAWAVPALARAGGIFNAAVVNRFGLQWNKQKRVAKK